MVSKGTRRDVEVVLHFDDEGILVINGDDVRHVRPDERNTAAQIRDALNGKPVKGFTWLPDAHLSDVIHPDAPMIMLEEEGTPYQEYKGWSRNAEGGNMVICLGDSKDLNERDHERIKAELPTTEIVPISLGDQRSYLASQCIVIMLFILDSSVKSVE